jgi:hypothetical protein
MKNCFRILFVSLICSSAFAGNPVTNSVTVNGLTSATTPLSGSELIPLYQSGLKSATVAQVIKAASDAATAAQSYGNGVSNLLGTLARSNNIILANVADAGTLARSNSLNVANLTDAGSLARSNSLRLVNITDAGSAAYSNASAFYLASNPAGYQTAGQVSTAVNSAVAAATFGTATNGGSVAFSSVQVTNLVTPTLQRTIVYPGGLTTNLLFDCAQGTFFLVNLKAEAGGVRVNLVLTNYVDGNQIAALVKMDGASQQITVNQTCSPNPGNVLTTLSTVAAVPSAGQNFLYSWNVFGANILGGGARQQ